MFVEELSDVSDHVEEEEDDEEMENQDDEMESLDNNDNGKPRRVTFASESIISENPLDPDKYDQTVNKEEEEMMLEKIKGLFYTHCNFVEIICIHCLIY